MYCNNCGRVIVGNGRFCTNCGSVVLTIGKSSVQTNQLENNYNHIAADTINISNDDAEVYDSSLQNSVLEDNNQDTLSGEDVTVRERVKRISEERIKKEIHTAKQQRKEISPRSNSSNQHIDPHVETRIIGEKDFKGSPKEVAAKIKLLRNRKKLITFGSFVSGIIVIVMCMGYLFWRFAPPGDSYKHNFVQWMSTNANGRVNKFLFDKMKLGNYYSPIKEVDYSGIYISKKNSAINKLNLTYKENQLAGYYISGDKEYKLKGYVTSKGALLLLESLDGIPTATISGKLFSIGYLTAERVEQTSGKKDILSLEKL